MAYGKPHVRPRAQMKKLGEAGTSGQKQERTVHTQQGKTGLEGASEHSKPDWGGMPSSGPVKANAGEKPHPGGATVKFGKSPGEDENPKEHGIHNQAAGKEPKTPGSPGGEHMGSVDTLTHLIFHPLGGMANKDEATRMAPQQDGKFKDSGKKGPPKKTGVHNIETY